MINNVDLDVGDLDVTIIYFLFYEYCIHLNIKILLKLMYLIIQVGDFDHLFTAVTIVIDD